MVVEVQRRPLGLGAGRNRQLRSSTAHCDQELARRRGGEEEKGKRGEEKAWRATLKSNNLHLAEKEGR